MRVPTKKVVSKKANYTFRGKGFSTLKEVRNAARKGKDGQFTAKKADGSLVTIKVIGQFVATKAEGEGWK